MQNIKKLLLKSLLVILCLVIVFVVLYGIIIYAGWPFWTIGWFLLGIVGVVLSIYLVVSYIKNRREKNFVKEIIDQDNDSIDDLATDEFAHAKEIQSRWDEAIKTLRKSSLKKHGNPLYSLPWYMIIGESGNGKTTAIDSANLSCAFTDKVARTTGVTGTRNCDWWFSDQAILIDTAGRYAIPIDAEKDKKEWHSFLLLLAKYRKKEPLNGLIITISAEKLILEKEAEINQYGKDIRKRIDELMQLLGVVFPVYVMVTKCDLVEGMSAFTNEIQIEHLKQPMGVLNRNNTTDPTEFCSTTFSIVNNRLRALRLDFLHKTKSLNAASGILSFPEEFNKLNTGCLAFFKGVFQENPYQETPTMRGLFFSSGQQNGIEYSQFLDKMGFEKSRHNDISSQQGYFLNNFFSKVLPADRYFFSSVTRRKIRKNRFMMAGLISWICILLSLSGFLSYAFQKNYSALSGISQAIQGVSLQDTVVSNEEDVLEKIHSFNKLHKAIVKMEQSNDAWFIPSRFGLNESREVEQNFKNKFSYLFNSNFMSYLDNKIKHDITQFDSLKSYKEKSIYTDHLVKRIELLTLYLDGQDLGSQDISLPNYDENILGSSDRVFEETNQNIQQLYLSSIVWLEDKNVAAKQRKESQAMLRHILSSDQSNLDWLLYWVKSSGVEEIKLKDFWQGSLPLEKDLVLHGAYTKIGYEKIIDFIARINESLDNSGELIKAEVKFKEQYENQYFDAWKSFLTRFPEGHKTLKDRREWIEVGKQMITAENPYFNITKVAFDNLSPLSTRQSAPYWVKQIEKLNEIMTESVVIHKQAKKEGKAAQPRLLSKVSRKINSTDKKIRRELGVSTSAKNRPEQENLSVEEEETLIKNFADYLVILGGLSEINNSQKFALLLAQEIFEQDPTMNTTGFYTANTIAKDFQFKLNLEDDKISHLVTGPLDYIRMFTVKEAAPELDRLWNSEVLMEIDGVMDNREASKMLLGKGGAAINFVKGVAKPFINRNTRKGYYATVADGTSIPFKKEFFTFLSRGLKLAQSKQDSFSVTFKTKQTDVNKEAIIQPHATKMELECTDGTQTLLNRQFDTTKTFKWSLSSCQAVTYTISFNNLTLVKHYAAPNGARTFLREVSDGLKTYTQKDFPNEKKTLEAMKIKHIKVRYKVSGYQGVLRNGSSRAIVPPENIIKGWE